MSDLHYFVDGEIALEFGRDFNCRYYRYNVEDETLEYTDDNVRKIKKVSKINWNKSNLDLINFLDMIRNNTNCWDIIDLE